MKKLLTIITCLLVMALLCVPAFADDSGYYIKSYDVQSTLHENNTVSQTETITVHYNEPRHGIYRAFPEWVKMSHAFSDGSLKELTYNARIKNVHVSGAPFEDYGEDNVFYIRIGDEDRTVTGDVTYQISFTYDIGDDRMSEYDSIFYSVNGSDWDSRIENFTFYLKFEKPLPADSAAALEVYSGAYGSTGNEYIQWTGDADSISGQSVKTLPSYCAVTIYTQLPEGYFVGEREYSTTAAIVMGIILAIVGAFVLLKEIFTRPRRPVQTVEFYPPDGISSAEVGYIIDETSNDTDIISLVIWFASKGYLTIEEKDGKKKKDKHMLLHRIKSLPSNAPEYQKTLFDALFKEGDTCDLDDLPEKFYEEFVKSKTELTAEFAGERALHKKWSEALAFILPIIVIILTVIFAALAPAGTAADSAIIPLISAVFLGTVLFIGICASVRWTFAGIGAKLGYALGIALAAIGGFSLMAVAAGEAIINPAFVLAAYVLALIVCLFAPRLAVYSDYRTETAGKLLGLRDFIEKAELDRIKALAEQDPTYYYDIIPYAYVYGLSDVWARNFEGLAIAPPTWYIADNTAFNMMMFNNMMNRNLTSAVTHIHTMSSGSGGSFGGGGGFSGGGFGGGGGGSW